MKDKLNSQLIGSSDKETILFLHGIGTASWSWWQQVEYFKENYSILLVDLPGHGENAHIPWGNMDRVVDLVADTIPPNQAVHVVGLSLGGHVALDLAKKYPYKIKSAYISGITTKPMGPKFFKIFLPLHLRQQSKLQKNDKKLEKLFVEMGLPQDKIAASITEYKKVSIDTFRSVFNDLYSFKLDYSYRKMRLPIMFVAGEHEDRSVQASLRYAPLFILQAKSKLIKRVRHQWPVQNPELFNHEVGNWLTSIHRRQAKAQIDKRSFK